MRGCIVKLVAFVWLSPLCFFKCLLKVLGWEQAKSHCLHLFDFSCNHCDSYFAHRQTLNTHMRIPRNDLKFSHQFVLGFWSMFQIHRIIATRIVLIDKLLEIFKWDRQKRPIQCPLPTLSSLPWRAESRVLNVSPVKHQQTLHQKNRGRCENCCGGSRHLA